jgi:hypothetical protein
VSKDNIFFSCIQSIDFIFKKNENNKVRVQSIEFKKNEINKVRVQSIVFFSFLVFKALNLNKIVIKKISFYSLFLVLRQ